MVVSSESYDGKRPGSRRVYVKGKIHSEVNVSMREIELSPTKKLTGEAEINEAVRIYDCSGPWGDAQKNCDVEQGLPALREKWIHDRNDVEEYAGRGVKPEDDGYLSERHIEHTSNRDQHRASPGLSVFRFVARITP